MTSPSSTAPRNWRRFVAVGDAFTEGLCDPDPAWPDTFIGWADRLAASLAGRGRAAGVDVTYANLAIRGRQLADVTGRQLSLALELEPDLVSIVGGGADLLLPRADVDALAAQLDDAVARARATGADVLLATPSDPQDAPILRRTRGRTAMYAAHIWSISRRHGCAVIDLWGMRALRDWRMWHDDRIHLSTLGHMRVGEAALAALGLGDPNGPWSVPMPGKIIPTRRAERRATRQWAHQHVRPWVHSRLAGKNPAEGTEPKRAEPTPVETADKRTSASLIQGRHPPQRPSAGAQPRPAPEPNRSAPQGRPAADRPDEAEAARDARP